MKLILLFQPCLITGLNGTRWTRGSKKGPSTDDEIFVLERVKIEYKTCQN